MHERLHEYFYLLDGEIRFQLATEVLTASAGSLVSVPPNTIHGFAVASETARVLNLYTPGGFNQADQPPRHPATELRLPRQDEQAPPTSEHQGAYLARSAELNTQRWLSPDEAEDLLETSGTRPEDTRPPRFCRAARTSGLELSQDKNGGRARGRPVAEGDPNESPGSDQARIEATENSAVSDSIPMLMRPVSESML